MARHSFFCIDGHTCGNPVRLVAGGGPNLQGANMIEKRAHFLAEYDWIRTGLMFEPRGHDMMSGSILYPPTRPDCDVAILFIETSGCLPMCGHGTIGTGDHGHRARPRHAEDAGRPDARHAGRRGEGRVPAGRPVCGGGAHHQRARLPLCARPHRRMPGLGEVTVDVAYGGNFYAIVEPQEHFRDMADFTAGELIGMSGALRKALNAKYEFVHPGKAGDTRPVAYPVDRRAEARRGACAQRGVLRRQGHRPLALRHRHLGAHRPLGRQRQAEGRRRLRAREHHRLAVQGPGRGDRARWAMSTPSSRPSAAGPA